MIHAVEAWFGSRGWSPFGFQRDCWDAQRAGRSGLVHAPTGLGKTYAAWFGAVLEAAEAGAIDDKGVLVVWVTPLRALSSDTADALMAPSESIGLPWRVELRTGDTPSSRKARQRTKPPQVLVTTPESLTILLSYPDGADLFERTRCVIVDEWHELMGSKRGVQTELALARLRAIAPAMRTWGLSATLGNLEEAARTLVGPSGDAAMIRGLEAKRIEVETLLPDDVERYPWAGHIGIALLDKVIAKIESAGTTLLFTNTRSQTEIWFRSILRRRPDLLGRVAVHHGSLDRSIRDRVEELLRADRGDVSELKCVVCTSSLDLGVDFLPVDQVIQVGSPKGVARLLQRAGRSGHRPGATSRIVCVPSHALELVEYAAARRAIEAGEIESRPGVRKPMDVLVQHLVTRAAGGGFDEAGARQEVTSTASFAELSDAEWDWAMGFVSGGGHALRAYPEYERIARRDGGVWRTASPQIERRHRMGIGTIVGDGAVNVQYVSGRSLGTIEESFVAKLRRGDRFTFAGRVLELVKLRGMTAQVRRSRSARGIVPRWGGGKMPLSSHLAEAVRRELQGARDGMVDSPEMRAVAPLLERQRSASIIPGVDELLVERISIERVHHVFLYPFGGRLAHEGMGAVLAWRLAQHEPNTIRATATDYGIELCADEPIDADEASIAGALSTQRLTEDLVDALNATELARRQFREIARIAGLTFAGYPGQRTLDRHLQASSDMFYDVFRQFDADNMLLAQAQREVVEGQLEFQRLKDTMERAGRQRMRIVDLDRLSPMAFPLWAETIRSTTATSESWESRIRRMALKLETGEGSAARG